MTWAQTSRGRALDLLAPVAEDICLLEVGQALGQNCRYNGCVRFYCSVAEHSVLVARHFIYAGDYQLALGALLHDGAEAYMGDITYPVQQVLFLGNDQAKEAYKAMRHRLDVLIAEAAGCDVSWLHAPEVCAVDLRILLDERAVLLGPCARPNPAIDGMDPLGVTLPHWEPRKAKTEWLGLLLALQHRLGVPSAPELMQWRVARRGG